MRKPVGRPVINRSKSPLSQEGKLFETAIEKRDHHNSRSKSRKRDD